MKLNKKIYTQLKQKKINRDAFLVVVMILKKGPLVAIPPFLLSAVNAAFESKFVVQDNNQVYVSKKGMKAVKTFFSICSSLEHR